MQDTTSSAMTEVALGLSMAFFTLLIVALLSMSVPHGVAIHDRLKSSNNTSKDLTKKTKVDIKVNNKANDDSIIQFAFYYNNNFYDKSLIVRTIDSFAKEAPLVIAVDPQLAFADVFALRQQVNHPKLSITLSNKAWRTRLTQKITLD
jgi:hypothetical protein